MERWVFVPQDRSGKQQGITVSPTTEHSAAQRRSTFKQEVFLKSQVWTNVRNKVQRGPTTLSEMSCFTVPFYAITYSGEIYTLNYAHMLEQLPYYRIPYERAR